MFMIQPQAASRLLARVMSASACSRCDACWQSNGIRVSCMCPHATICVLILLCKQVTRAGSQMEYAKALVEYHDDVEADPGPAMSGRV